MSNDNFAKVVFPNRCKRCIQNDVPASDRAVVILGSEEICGYCGGSLGSAFSIRSTVLEAHSPLVRTILRTLVGHGILSIDPDPDSWNPIRLLKLDDNVGLITCKIGHSFASTNSQHNPEKRRIYSRDKVACVLPPCVRAACEVLSNLSVDGTYLQFDGADVRREAKTIRFSWEVLRRTTTSGNDWQFSYESVHVEIAWVTKAESQAWIPSEEQLAMKTRDKEAAEAELRIARDVATLRFECAKAINAGKFPCMVWLTELNNQTALFESSFHGAAVGQVVEELSMHWSAQVCTSPMTPPEGVPLSYLLIERKP